MKELIEKYLKQHHCRYYFNRYGETVEDEHYFMYRQEIDDLVEFVVQECIDTLLFHGCDDDVRYLEWMAANKLGVKL